MKPILIDDINDEFGSNSSEFTVEVNGTSMKGWQIAKPLNYDPDHFQKKERKEMAQAILDGKAIAVCFFEDLSESDKSQYVKNKLEKIKKFNQTLDKP